MLYIIDIAKYNFLLYEFTMAFTSPVIADVAHCFQEAIDSAKDLLSELNKDVRAPPYARQHVRYLIMSLSFSNRFTAIPKSIFKSTMLTMRLSRL